ncbi:MAG: cyclic-di-AMP receptor [Anaerolineales bacterium]|nr:cyclic-di-AMP receptor [Anaerolineales bacterium]
MKLILAIVRDTDDRAVIDALITHNYRVTRVASTGGFLRRGNVTLMIGVEADQVPPVLDLLRETCAAPEPEQHRATVFVVDMPHFEQI